MFVNNQGFQFVCFAFNMQFVFFTGGESAWGEAFKDEFKPNLIHQGQKDE